VTLTPEELEEASERAAETAEMAQLYEEALKIERKRVEAELARRNDSATRRPLATTHASYALKSGRTLQHR